MDTIDAQTWIAACAHQLQRQWRTVDPEQLEEVAADLWRDERLRAKAPGQAAADWLAPVAGRAGEDSEGAPAAFAARRTDRP